MKRSCLTSVGDRVRLGLRGFEAPFASTGGWSPSFGLWTGPAGEGSLYIFSN